MINDWLICDDQSNGKVESEKEGLGGKLSRLFRIIRMMLF